MTSHDTMSERERPVKKARHGLSREQVIDALADSFCSPEALAAVVTGSQSVSATVVAAPTAAALNALGEVIIVPGAVDTVTEEQHNVLVNWAPQMKKSMDCFNDSFAQAADGLGELRAVNTLTMRNRVQTFVETVHSAKKDLNESLCSNVYNLVGSLSVSALLQINEVYHGENVRLGKEHAEMAAQRDQLREELEQLKMNFDTTWKLQQKFETELRVVKAEQVVLHIEKEEWAQRTKEALRLMLPESLERISMDPLVDQERSVTVPQSAVVGMMQGWKSHNVELKRKLAQGPLTTNAHGESVPTEEEVTLCADELLNTLT